MHPPLPSTLCDYPTLFTQVRGSEILGSPIPENCIAPVLTAQNCRARSPRSWTGAYYILWCWIKLQDFGSSWIHRLGIGCVDGGASPPLRRTCRPLPPSALLPGALLGFGTREDYPLRSSPVRNLPGSCSHSKVVRQDTRRHRHHAPTAIIKRVASVVT
jgi:hypothetical protein